MPEDLDALRAALLRTDSLEEEARIREEIVHRSGELAIGDEDAESVALTLEALSHLSWLLEAVPLEWVPERRAYRLMYLRVLEAGHRWGLFWRLQTEQVQARVACLDAMILAGAALEDTARVLVGLLDEDAEEWGEVIDTRFLLGMAHLERSRLRPEDDPSFASAAVGTLTDAVDQEQRRFGRADPDKLLVLAEALEHRARLSRERGDAEQALADLDLAVRRMRELGALGHEALQRVELDQPGVLEEIVDLYEHRVETAGEATAEGRSGLIAMIETLSRVRDATSEPVDRAHVLWRIGQLHIRGAESFGEETTAGPTELERAVTVFREMLALGREQEEVRQDRGEYAALLGLVECLAGLVRQEQGTGYLEELIETLHSLLGQPEAAVDVDPDQRVTWVRSLIEGFTLFFDREDGSAPAEVAAMADQALDVLDEAETLLDRVPEAWAEEGEDGSAEEVDSAGLRWEMGFLRAGCLVGRAQMRPQGLNRTREDVHGALTVLTALIDAADDAEKASGAAAMLSLTTMFGLQTGVVGEEQAQRALDVLQDHDTGLLGEMGHQAEMVGLFLELLRASRSDDPDDLDRVVERVRGLPASLAPEQRLIYLDLVGGALLTRYFQRGDLADCENAYVLVTEGLDLFRQHPGLSANVPPGTHVQLRIHGQFVGAALSFGRGHGWPKLTGAWTREITAQVRALDPGYPQRAFAMSELGMLLFTGELEDPEAVIGAGSGFELILEAARADRDERPEQQTQYRNMSLLRAASAVLTLTEAGSGPGNRRVAAGQVTPELLEEATGWMEDLARDAEGSIRLRARSLLALFAERRFLRGHDFGDLAAAFREMERLCEEVDPLHPLAVELHWRSAELGQRVVHGGDPSRVRRSELLALTSLVRQTWLQPDSRQALVRARDAARRAGTAAHRELLRDGDPGHLLAVLELGKGLLLHTATHTVGVARLLRDAGEKNLAREWEDRLAEERARSRADTTEARDATERLLTLERTDDLRHRALRVLSGTEAFHRLLETPGPAEVSETLRLLGQDALVVLVPAPARERGGGGALVVTARGATSLVRLPGLESDAGAAAEFLKAVEELSARDPDDGLQTERQDHFRKSLAAVRDWAAPVLAPLLGELASPGGERLPRLVLTGAGELSSLPWHAVMAERAVVSHTATVRQLVDVTRRTPVPLTGRAVLVQDPTGDLEFSGPEVRALARDLYPGALILGEDGQVSAREILEHVRPPDDGGASLLHMSTHARSGDLPEESYVPLGQEQLTVQHLLAAVRTGSGAGAMVTLMSCGSDRSTGGHDQALSLASAFLSAGAATVVSSRWAVPDERAAVLSYLFHHYLRREGLRPAEALRAAQLCMAAPERCPVALPEEFGWEPDPDRDLACWAAFTHQGW